MLVYIAAIFLTLIFAVTYDLSMEKTRKQILLKNAIWLVSTIPLILIAALRYDIGIDYKMIYWRFYLAAGQGYRTTPGSKVKIEYGLYLVNRVLNIFSDNPVIFFVVSSIFIYFVIFYFIKNEHKKIFWAVFFFFFSGLYFASLNVIRQFIAIAIVIIGWKYCKSKSIYKYMLLCFLACFIHTSAIVLILLYFFYYLEMSRKRFWALGVVAVLAMPLLSQIFMFIIRNTRYCYYLSSVLFVVDIDIAGTIYAFIITAITFLFYEDVKKIDNFNFCMWIVLGYDLIMIFSGFIPLCNRFGIYFKFWAFVYYLPKCIGGIENRSLKILIEGFIIMFMISSCYYLYVNKGLSGIYPYQSIIGKI